MCYNHGMMAILVKVSWFLTAFGAISLGLSPLGYNFAEKISAMLSPSLVAPFYYLIGIAGIISLLVLFTSCSSSKECKC